MTPTTEEPWTSYINGEEVTEKQFDDFKALVESMPDLVILDPRGEFLRDKRHKGFSQFGEEGLIISLLAKIGATSRWCFEVGAADGVTNSNTKALRDVGWSAVLIEADAKEYSKLRAHQNENVSCVYFRITPGSSLDNLLQIHGAPDSIDLGIIDIDSDDAAVFDAMSCKPRVMLVEFNPCECWMPAEYRDHAAMSQAYLGAVLTVGQSKGYVPLCKTFCNVLFVREDCI